MLEFRHRRSLTIWPKEISYFQSRVFDILGNIQADNEVINAFIASKYFYWQENKIDKVPWTINGEETYVDYNFHGIYDIKLLTFDDYLNVNFSEFEKHFIDSMHKEIGNDPLLIEIQKLLDDFNSQFVSYYILNPGDAKKHKYSVFEYFYSGVIINNDNQTFSIVEFALD